MTTTKQSGGNTFLSGSMPSLFLRTAAPIILIMGLNGLLTVVDAYFLGSYVGADALAAVTLMFPAYMLLVALATLVATGLASIIARLLGAGNLDRAREVFMGAHGLSLLVSLALITAFWFGGSALIGWMANGNEDLSRMGYAYISIIVCWSPLMFALSINSDALRSEGKLGLMAGASALTTLANIAFNYVLIVILDQGVAGSAIGTVMAQALAMMIIIAFRIWGSTALRWSSLPLSAWRTSWPELLALGAPQSLSFLGIALGSGAVIFSLQLWNVNDYPATVAAYGIATRIMTFTFLPLLGLSMATQTIVGNNFGAQLWNRTDRSLMFGLLTALVYCVVVQIILLASRSSVGAVFVDDATTITALSRILPLITLTYFATGPMMILSGFFQAIGDAKRALLLSVTQTYLFNIPMIFCLPFLLGTNGIWLAGAAAQMCMVIVMVVMLVRAERANGFRWGVFRADALAPVAA